MGDSSRCSSIQNCAQVPVPGAGPVNFSQCITGTCPATASPHSSRSSSVHDASQRSPVTGGSQDVLNVSGICNMTVPGSNDALKSWLSGAAANGTSESELDLVERLRAAAPESYED